MISTWDKLQHYGERKIKAAETARQEEYEKLQRETEEKNQENNKSVKSVKLPDMEMPELERAEPDKVVEIKSPDMIPEVNPVKKNVSIEMPVKAEMEETEADAEKNGSRKEETSAELPMTVSPEKEKTELTAVKVKGNVQREEDVQKKGKGRNRRAGGSLHHISSGGGNRFKKRCNIRSL